MGNFAKKNCIHAFIAWLVQYLNVCLLSKEKKIRLTPSGFIFWNNNERCDV